MSILNISFSVILRYGMFLPNGPARKQPGISQAVGLFFLILKIIVKIIIEIFFKILQIIRSEETVNGKTRFLLLLPQHQ